MFILVCECELGVLEYCEIRCISAVNFSADRMDPLEYVNIFWHNEATFLTAQNYSLHKLILVF